MVEGREGVRGCERGCHKVCWRVGVSESIQRACEKL